MEVEMKDDRKDNSYEAIWSAIYSNSESIIWTHASIFEAQQGISMISEQTKDTFTQFYTIIIIEALVYARQRQLTRHWFLTSDSTEENNLDFLPHCVRP